MGFKEEEKEEEKPDEVKETEEKPAEEKEEDVHNENDVIIPPPPPENEENGIDPNSSLMMSLYPQQMAHSGQSSQSAGADPLDVINEEDECLPNPLDQAVNQIPEVNVDIPESSDLDVEAEMGLPPVSDIPMDSLDGSEELPIEKPEMNSTMVHADQPAVNSTAVHMEKDFEQLDFDSMQKSEKGYYLNMMLTKAMGLIDSIPVGC